MSRKCSATIFVRQVESGRQVDEYALFTAKDVSNAYPADSDVMVTSHRKSKKYGIATIKLIGTEMGTTDRGAERSRSLRPTFKELSVASGQG